jgi:amidase
MARSVTDAAILLDVLAGPDPRDPATLEVAAPEAPYASQTDADGLRGQRIGLVRLHGEVVEGDAALLAGAKELLERAGAEVVDLAPLSLLGVAAEGRDFFAIADHDFRRGVDAYLAQTGAPLRSLADVIAWNARDPGARVPFGQDTLVRAQESGVTEAAHARTLARSRERARRSIDALLARSDLDALAGLGVPFSVPYCAAGYPALSVPAGRRASGEPVGLVFVGRFLGEPVLIRAAFAFEATARARRAPLMGP